MFIISRSEIITFAEKIFLNKIVQLIKPPVLLILELRNATHFLIVQSGSKKNKVFFFEYRLQKFKCVAFELVI